MCNACKSCIYEEKEYLEALEKAMQNNPGLFAEQEKLNKRKQKHRKLTKVGECISNGSLIIGFCITLYGLFSFKCPAFLLPVCATFFLIAIVGTVIININDTNFWNETSKVDYWLYKQQKLEFSKVGYELP